MDEKETQHDITHEEVMHHETREAKIGDIKKDLEKLYQDTESVAGQTLDEASARWKETHAQLDQHYQVVKEKSTVLTEQGSAAAEDMKHGFMAAFTELKNAFFKAREKFTAEKPDVPGETV